MTHSQRIAHQYDTISNEFDTTRQRIWKSVQSFIIENASIHTKSLLDVGVGNAKNVIFAQTYNYDCIGIDISKNLLEICKNKNIKSFYKDVLDLRQTDYGTFDSILCIAVIHHLENIDMQKLAIRNMIDCLKPDGKLLISVWSKETYDIHDTDNSTETKDARHFHHGANNVEWKSRKSNSNMKSIKRFYFIHDYESFHTMISDLNVDFKISWERQNWFCEIKK